MALQFTSWKADGAGQVEISHIRSDIKNWFNSSTSWLEIQKSNPECVLITKDRTDKQSNVQHIIWQRPGYVDPVNQ